MKQYRLGSALIFAITLPMLAACSQNFNDLYDYIERTKATYVGSVSPIPQFKPYESFAYSAGELRDPFVANAEVEEDKEGRPTPIVHASRWRHSRSIRCEWSV